MSLTRILKITAVSLGVLSLLAACGDETSSTVSTPNSSEAPINTDDGSTDQTSTSYKMPKQTFESVDGTSARFVNVYAKDGAGVDIDVYWGTDATTGEKAATVPYGSVSESIPIKVRNDAFGSSDGPKELKVSFYKKGETARENQLMYQSEPLKSDTNLLFNLGWTKPLGAASSGASLGVAYVSEMAQAPAGKAVLLFNEIGVAGIEGGDFMTIDAVGACSQWLINNDFKSANGGTAYLVDPGALSVAASDANSDCTQTTPPASLTLAAGDRYAVYVYGPSKTERKLLTLKLSN